MIGATIVCAIACLALVAAEYRRAQTAKMIAKPIASLAFIVVGVLAATTCEAPRGWHAYELWIIVGLVLGAVGDVALLGKSSRAFLVGLGAFLLGHIAYIVAFAQLAPPLAWLAAPALVPLIVGGAVLAYLWPRLGDMRVPVIAYVIAIVTMMSAAIAVARVPELAQQNRTLLVLGAALFFASDFAVARDRFVGELLIAWSIQIPGCAG
jgi:uncharacterized membrane protein YhhN